jgi:hypothetical protein
MMRRTTLAVVAAFLVTALTQLVPSTTAIAHGSCVSEAKTPFDAGVGIGGVVHIECFSNIHDRYKLWGCFQRKATDGSWVNIDCVLPSDTGTGADTGGFGRQFTATCVVGRSYRTQFREGRVYNNSGTLVHHLTANKVSNVLTVTNC